MSTVEQGPEGDDNTDAKGFLGGISSLMCGTAKQLGMMTIEDVDVEEELSEAYKKAPPMMTRKEMLADVYKMDHPRRGKAIVINNKHFSAEMQKKGYGVRSGTDVDATKISSRLKMLGFDVERHHDATCKTMIKAFSSAAAEDHSDADCFVGVILSHGDQESVLGADGLINMQDIFQYFKGNNCKSLAGKPKLFFIQACRGNMLDKPVDLNVADAIRYDDESAEEIRIPNEADFLISYSTVPGYYSWRNSANGSWYIQALVAILDKYGTTMELQKLLTKLNKYVAYSDRFMSNTMPTNPGMHGMKQIPSFTSMLTKDLYFIPK